MSTKDLGAPLILTVAAGFTAPARRRWAKVWRGAKPPPMIPTTLGVGPVRDEHLAATAAAIALAFGMPPQIAGWIAALHGRLHRAVHRDRRARRRRGQPLAGQHVALRLRHGRFEAELRSPVTATT